MPLLSNAMPCACPLPGNRLAIACRQATTNYPTYAIVAGMSYDYPLSIVADVTPCTPITLSYNTRYSLAGIAVTGCVAGGAGIIQTNGAATLGANYPSTTNQLFDFRNPTALGVKGSVTGRNVNMGN